MPTDADPVVDSWFENLDENLRFKVIALDDAIGVMEIQLYDGSLEEMDLDTWYLMDIEPIDDPDDWAGTLGDLEQQDSEFNDPPDDWAEGASGETPWDEEE